MSDIVIVQPIALEEITQVEVIANRWFNGLNTYHSVAVLALIDKSHAESLGITGSVKPVADGYVWVQLGYNSYAYGYERGYEQTAYNVLKAAAPGNYQDLDNVNVGSIYTACQMLMIPYRETVTDVKRKKDL